MGKRAPSHKLKVHSSGAGPAAISRLSLGTAEPSPLTWKVSGDCLSSPAQILVGGTGWVLECFFLPPRLALQAEARPATGGGGRGQPGHRVASLLCLQQAVGTCRALGSCAQTASQPLCKGWLGGLPRAEEKLPRDWAQALLFSQKFQPFKDQGPEKGLFQDAREQVFQHGSITGPSMSLP